MKTKNDNSLNNKAIPKSSQNAINAYESCADRLGSYTGITDEMKAKSPAQMKAEANLLADMRIEGGKTFCRLDDLPVQDADDL